MLAVTVACAVSAARADVVRYTDHSGAVHYVSRLDLVPEEFREQAAAAAPLAGVSRVAPGRKTLYEKEHYASSSVGKNTVEIFVTSWCPHCKELEDFLKTEGIPFTRYDIEHDAKGKKIHDELGGGGIPVVRINGSKVIHGFAPDAIKSALKKS